MPSEGEASKYGGVFALACVLLLKDELQAFWTDCKRESGRPGQHHHHHQHYSSQVGSGFKKKQNMHEPFKISRTSDKMSLSWKTPHLITDLFGQFKITVHYHTPVFLQWVLHVVSGNTGPYKLVLLLLCVFFGGLLTGLKDAYCQLPVCILWLLSQ